MKDEQGNKHDYESAGFNRFFRRTLSSDVFTTSLRTVPRRSNSNQLNFDTQQISGAMGDALSLGRIRLDGKTGRISVFDERTNEVMRLGNLGDE